MTIVDHATRSGGRLDRSAIPRAWRETASDYAALLEQANGLELHDGLVRVFGIGPEALTRDAVSWNAEPWRAAYSLPASILLWGENIFGDQYGFDLQSRSVLRIDCEGGEIERFLHPNVNAYVEQVLLGDPRKWIELDLINAARSRGLQPSNGEHLSFGLPLVCGGRAEVDNLEVLDASSHLAILGQIIEQSRDVPEGTPIRSFNS